MTFENQSCALIDPKPEVHDQSPEMFKNTVFILDSLQNLSYFDFASLALFSLEFNKCL